MKEITIEIKDNGYEAQDIQPMVQVFNRAALKLFPGCTVRHFYYGDYVSMASIRLSEGHYGQFNISKNRVSFNGHSCTTEQLKQFESMTHNDELFNGKLLDLAK